MEESSLRRSGMRPQGIHTVVSSQTLHKSGVSPV